LQQLVHCLLAGNASLRRYLIGPLYQLAGHRYGLPGCRTQCRAKLRDFFEFRHDAKS
jgi:hypothetical protein